MSWSHGGGVAAIISPVPCSEWGHRAVALRQQQQQQDRFVRGRWPQSGPDRRAANTMADCSDISSELNMSASSDTPDPVPPLTIRVHSPAAPPRQERLPRTRAVDEIFTIFNRAFSLLNSHSKLIQFLTTLS